MGSQNMWLCVWWCESWIRWLCTYMRFPHPRGNLSCQFMFLLCCWKCCKGAHRLGHGNKWKLSPKQELGAHMWRSELWYSNQEKKCNASTGNTNTRLIKLLLNSFARQIWADLLFKGKIFNYLLILMSTGDPRSTYWAPRILFRSFWSTLFSCLWSIRSELVYFSIRILMDQI